MSGPLGPVTPAAFDAFLDRSVTPRFPAGMTVLDGAGRWQAPDGRQTREASRLVLIVTPDGPAARARLDAVRRDYATRFGQRSVGLVTVPACAAF